MRKRTAVKMGFVPPFNSATIEVAEQYSLGMYIAVFDRLVQEKEQEQVIRVVENAVTDAKA
jgi:hypothetical protein